MCTTIANTELIAGSAKSGRGWLDFNQVTVAFDHPSHAPAEHALLVDFANYAKTDDRVGLELDLAAGKALLVQLQDAIKAAEAAGFS